MFNSIPENTSRIEIYLDYGRPIKLSDQPEMTIRFAQGDPIWIDIESKGIGPDPIGAKSPALHDWIENLAWNQENGMKEVYYNTWEFEDMKALERFLQLLRGKEYAIAYS